MRSSDYIPWRTVFLIVATRALHLLTLRFCLVVYSFMHVRFGSWISPLVLVEAARDWRKRIIINTRVRIEPNVLIKFHDREVGFGFLKVGSNVFIGRGTVLDVFDNIEIGSDTMIGSRCYIVSQNHGISAGKGLMREQPMAGNAVVIEGDVWLGSHVVILPGVRIGHGSVVGAGSVVTKSIPEGEVWGGVPARYIRKR
jgi:acetyltransferase-like isoleucine patch superfamily enzyme